jgi:hypothetical protein
MVFLGGQMERAIMASLLGIKDTGKVNRNGPMVLLMLENFKTMYEKVMADTHGLMARQVTCLYHFDKNYVCNIVVITAYQNNRDSFSKHANISRVAMAFPLNDNLNL